MTLIVARCTDRSITLAADQIVSAGEGIAYASLGNKIATGKTACWRRFAIAGAGDLSAIQELHARAQEIADNPELWRKRKHRPRNVDALLIYSDGEMLTLTYDGAIIKESTYAVCGHDEATLIALGALAVEASMASIFAAAHKHCPIIGAAYDAVSFRLPHG